MPEVLEPAHPLERHGVPEVKVGGGGVESHFHAQRDGTVHRSGQLAKQVLARVHIDRPAGHLRELLGRRRAPEELLAHSGSVSRMRRMLRARPV